MGTLSAAAIREHLSELAALEWHFTSNHYPPLPRQLIPVAVRCLKAERKARRTGTSTYGKRVRLPEGITYKGRYKTAPIEACMNSWHLWDFVE